MPWQTIIDADSTTELEALQDSDFPLDDVPPGSKVKIRIELPSWAPVGKLADLAGAEWWANQFIGADIQVTDVYGNWHWIEIEGIAYGTPVLLIVGVIIVALSILGITWLVSRILLEADIPNITKAGVGLAVGIGFGIIGLMLLTKGKARAAGR